MDGETALRLFELGVLGVIIVLILRGDLRLKREVEREEKAVVREQAATQREREIGSVALTSLEKQSEAMDRLTEAVLRDRAGGG